MAAILATQQQVLDLAPQLVDAAADDPVQFALIVDTITPCMLVQSHWGTKLDEGHRTLAAHFATLCLNPGAVGGVVTARSIDKISESYAVGAFEDAEMSTTKFGRMHLALLAALRVRQSRSVSAGNDPPDFSLPEKRIM
jgi:hypothetical protein